MAQQGTGTPQNPIKTKLYFQKKGLVYECTARWRNAPHTG